MGSLERVCYWGEGGGVVRWIAENKEEGRTEEKERGGKKRNRWGGRPQAQRERAEKHAPRWQSRA